MTIGFVIKSYLKEFKLESEEKDIQFIYRANMLNSNNNKTLKELFMNGIERNPIILVNDAAPLIGA